MNIKCEDCKYAQDAQATAISVKMDNLILTEVIEKYCLIFEDGVDNNHFCEYGERKEE